MGSRGGDCGVWAVPVPSGALCSEADIWDPKSPAATKRPREMRRGTPLRAGLHPGVDMVPGVTLGTHGGVFEMGKLERDKPHSEAEAAGCSRCVWGDLASHWAASTGHFTAGSRQRLPSGRSECGAAGPWAPGPGCEQSGGLRAVLWRPLGGTVFPLIDCVDVAGSSTLTCQVSAV